MPWDQGDIPPLENPPTTEMLAKLEEGFAVVRSYAGFSNFGVPDYVWTYIGPNERDRVIVYVYNAIFTVRADDEYWYANNEYVHREEIFAWTYVLFLLVEWWCDQPNNLVTNREHATAELVLAALENDWGFSAGSLTDASLASGASGINWFDISISDIKHPAGLSSYFDAELYLYWEEGYSYASIYQNTNQFYYFGREVDTYSWDYNYFWDDELYEATYDAYWGDVGLIAYWPKEEEPIFINGEHEVISARATFKDFGLMDGSVETIVALDEGSQVQVARGSDVLFTGIVTEVKASLVDGVYSISVSDPVTAGGGEVEFTSGDAIDALREAIESHGGTLETAMETEETVVYTERKVDAWQFFRSVCYAVGGVLQYGRDGVYRLVEGGSGHSVTDNMIIGDDRPTIEERTKDYANRVAASIDQEWRTEAVENTIETFTSPGAGYAEITRFGEQIISQEVNFSGGSQTTYTHDYDENGYCIKTIEEEEGAQEIGSMKRVRTLEFTDISEDGNEYKASDVIETYNYGYSPISEENGWILIARTTLNWDVNLDGISFVEEIEQGTTPIGGGSVLLETDDGGGGTVNLSVPICSGFEVAWPELWNRRRWVASIVTSPVAGPIEGFTSCTEYSWTEVGINADPGSALGFCSRLGWYQLPSRSDKSYTVPKLEVYAPEDTHEVHILAKAEDPDAIDALGEYEYECQAVSLDTETGMQAFALGVLFEKGRIRHANVSVPNDDYLALDTVIWRGLEWLIDSVIVDLDRCCDVIEMVTTSTLARLQNSISREPVSWIEDVKNVVTKKTALYDNVARGRIMSQVGFRRYLVQAEGKATPIEAKALTDDPHLVDGSVLLVKPSGKGQPWTLLSLSKEQEIAMPETVTAKVTPNLDPGPPEILTFTADEYTTTPCQLRTLSWTFADEVMSMGAEITPGDGGESFDVEGYGDPGATELRLMTIGEITPSIRPWILGVYGGKIYGTSVDLDEPIVVSEPEITDFSVDEGDILFGVAHGVNVSACYAPGMLVMVNHGDGSGYHQHEMNETGEHSHENTWYATGDYTIYAKLRFVQNNGQPWESEAEELPVTVLSNPNMGGGVVSIGGKEYISLPVGGEFLYEDSPNAIITDNDINSINVASTLSNDGVLGSVMSYELSLTLKGENINSAGHYANLYLIAPQTWYPTMDCAGGIPTEYVGCKDAFGYPLCGDYYYSCWLLNFYKAPGEDELKLWSGAWGIKNTSATWWTNHRTVSTIFAECPSSFSLPILITRSKIPGYPASQLTDRLFIDGTHVASIRAQYAWRDPFNYMTRNVPNNSSGRSFRMIAQKTGGGMSFDGNVKLWVPQQLIGYHPSIVPGGNCEFTWDKPGFTPEY